MNGTRIGERVRSLREQRRMSLGALAEKAGTHENTIRLIESGRGNPTIRVLSEVAGALGVRLKDLLA